MLFWNGSPFKTYLEDKFKHQEGYLFMEWAWVFSLSMNKSYYKIVEGIAQKLIGWVLRSKKDFVGIEHVLPQTPTDQYWQNNFANYNDEEIKNWRIIL